MVGKQTKAKGVLNILILLFLVSALFVFRLLHDSKLQYPYGLSNFVDRGDYKIEPNSILQDLERGEKDVFKPGTNISLEVNSAYKVDSFSWQHSDYMEVAKALHQFVWNETLNDWKMYGMIFARRCQDNPRGFEGADFTFYKNNKRGGYTVHEMDLYPGDSGVSWGGSDNWSRPLFGWTSINLQRLKITADDALQIAEENGGTEFRVKTSNMCDIQLVIKPNPDGDNDWIVGYYANNGSEHFEIQINPYTGWH
ncbi:MAG: PepSY domain-containing protein [Anaerolineales bacterium]